MQLLFYIDYDTIDPKLHNSLHKIYKWLIQLYEAILPLVIISWLDHHQVKTTGNGSLKTSTNIG